MQETGQDQEQLFCRWVEDHRGLIFRVVHASESQPDAKSDLVQEILLQLWRSMPSFEGRCKETTWIYRVALNTARSWRRSEKRRRQRHEIVADFAIQIERAGEANPLVERLYEAIRQMPKSESSLLLLHLDGLGYEDIAEVLGVSEGCVGVRLTRARQQLAKRLKGEEDGL